jgi:tRNA uridine 5-carbamoylmethylation protein Kti12
MKRNKHYIKREASREGKLYFIFCEGERRETTYFYFFNKIATQIIIQIVPIEQGKNSPMGLFRNACEKLIKSYENPNPEYSLSDIDEVWFIIDTDKWGDEIGELRQSVTQYDNWFVAQSNPCFEVWLYYHIMNEKPAQVVENWKRYLHEVIPGGFDSRKHAKLIETAIENSKANFSAADGVPDLVTTEVHLLAERIIPLVKPMLDAL